MTMVYRPRIPGACFYHLYCGRLQSERHQCKTQGSLEPSGFGYLRLMEGQVSCKDGARKQGGSKIRQTDHAWYPIAFQEWQYERWFAYNDLLNVITALGITNRRKDYINQAASLQFSGNIGLEWVNNTSHQDPIPDSAIIIEGIQGTKMVTS